MKGFTLVELLVGLTIVMILTVLVVPNMYKLIQNQEIKTFFRQLDSDILYIQNETMSETKEFKLVFESNEAYYAIINQNNKQVKKVKIPKQIKYNYTKSTINFHPRGTVLNPRQLIFTVEDKKYKLVLPLGKGRHYIEEE